MTHPKTIKQKITDAARVTVLSKLVQMEKPMNMLEIGFSATPALIRNMAARGLVRVTVEVTQRGRDHLESERAKRKRIEVNDEKAARLARVSGSQF